MPEKPASIFLLTIIFLLSFVTSVDARDSNSDPLGSEPGLFENEYVPQPEDIWKEDKHIPMPDFPDDENLLQVNIDAVKAPYKYYIDEKSLSIGEDDVVRYIIILESRTGVRNTFYEGIHCAVNEYKVYAVASGDKLKPVRKSEWRSIRMSHFYRLDLRRNFLCNKTGMYPNQVDEIIQRIKYNTQIGE
ncbi:MAG: CNP1-like family protein [Gammaproteobacteria bacterium]|nr:CNP1-like family protein [Gammaproteobacteria bacterium]MDH5593633.1 CNP1-like family protein [Gammaproteobacteria bacterium]MDH5613534.1 CNP1-like family protein [Gammaproteobacteria bacterium]